MGGTCCHRENADQPAPRFAAERETDLCQSTRQLVGATAPCPNQRGEALTEDAARAAAIAAEEPPSADLQDDRDSAAGKVTDRTDVTAVNAAGSSTAQRAARCLASRQNVEDQMIVFESGFCDVAGGEVRKEVGGVHGEAPEVGCLVLPCLRASSRRRESRYSWRSTEEVDHEVKLYLIGAPNETSGT
jgi:hypothetical protein